MNFSRTGRLTNTKIDMKPLILITPLYDDERESLWMLPGYLKSLRDAGAWTLTLDLCDDEDYLLEMISLSSGIVISGGQDVNPSLYGEPTCPTCGPNNTTRDRMDMTLIRLAHLHDIPMLGICRGMQMMNVFYGGTLIQDIPTEVSTEVQHRTPPPYDKPAHSVTIDEDSLLYRIIGKTSIDVNSYHHQGVKRLATGLTAVAHSSDGLIEAAEHQGKTFMLGVQWHPEFLSAKDENQQNLFNGFAKAAEWKMNNR